MESDLHGGNLFAKVKPGQEAEKEVRKGVVLPSIIIQSYAVK